MSKKILSMLLVLTMLVGMLAVMPLTANAAEVTASNADIVINSVSDWMNKLSGKSVGEKTVFVNAKELDFSGQNVQPIKGFTGHFNGNGVIIKNMNITTSGETGMFGCIEAAVTIENIVVVSSSFKGQQWVGAIACCAGHGSDSDYAIIRNVYVGKDVTVTAKGTSGNAYAGGIVGGVAANGYLQVTDCVFEGLVTSDNSTAQNYMSGIVGNINKKKYVVVENCLFTGDVTNGVEGAVSGIMDGSSQTGSKIDYCISILAEDTIIKDSDKYSSGVKKGSYNWSTLRNVYGLNALANDPADTTNLIDEFTARDKDIMIPNGVKALETLNSSFTVPASIYYGTVSEAEAGTIVFKNWDGTVLQSSELEGDVMPEYTGETPTRPDEGIYSFKEWTPYISKVNGSAEYTATYTKSIKVAAPEEVDGKYVITEVAHWFYLMENTSEFDGETVVLGADLDFTGADSYIKPIGSFAGTLDGQGYTIKNVNMSRNAGDIALFDDLADNATIKNLVIKSSTFEITGKNNWLGTIACCTNGENVTISNIFVDKDVKVISNTTHDNSIAGGILGGVYGSGAVVTVSDCVFAGTVTGTGNYVAGIVGNAEAGNDTSVINCSNVGYVFSKGNYVAGIAVSGGITIENCVNAGKVVSSKSYVGGIYAGNPTNDVVITNCYTVGNFENHNTANGGAVTIEGGVANLAINDLTGLNAKVPATFTKKYGDYAVPAGCTVVYGTFVGLSLLDGASVRLSNPSGLRFTAVLGAAYLDSFKGEGKEVSFGILIAPTDYVNSVDEFTIKDLEALDVKGAKYKAIDANKCANDTDADESYVFTGVLAPVQEGNYNRNFSARAYIKVVEGDTVTYYYSEYDEDLNSRSIEYVAEKAYADTNPVQTEYYQYALNEEYQEEVEGEIITTTREVFSPYTEAQREILMGFIGLGEQ